MTRIMRQILNITSELLREKTGKMPKPRIVCGERRQPFTDSFALPPGLVTNRRKLIAVKPCADVMRWCIGKGIIREEREGAAIVMQKFPDKVQRPRILCRGSHRSEPDLPVDPRLVRRNERRSPVGIARFGLELIFLPFCIARN